ncbi:THO complex subunit 2-like isoform X2 [Mya arenaria]|uniref:THO complex subunit 2-like isoform X2 n=1 Tax=Mya arenaria TaxID=6604 RepID=UPI0022E68833|nr:THO complex subunit 2-like isoform X2 [Mya arenaria]
MAVSFLSPEQCKTWEKSGKQEFLKFINGVGDRSVLSSLGNRDFRQAIYDLCQHVIKGNLRVEQAIHVFHDLKDKYPDLISFVVDILSLIDVELSAVEEIKGAREKLCTLIQTLGNTFDCDALLKSRLDHETLESAGLVPSKTVFSQKHVKIKTRLYYKQQKFNLLREESEGYSKLVAELNQEITYKITPAVMLQNIKSLIGCFNLDPNRVIDVLLESFENRPEVEDFYIPLIQSYVQDNETLCHCLGLKFQFFKDDETPSSLFKLAAILLKNDLVHLETLYPHLHPVDSVILEYSKKEMADAKAYARKLMVINLADKSDEKKKEEEEVKIDVRVNNQKLGLVEALLCIGAWEKSKCILDWLPEFFATTHKPVASALCALIHTVMDPVYRTSSGMTSKLVSKWPPIEELGGSVPRATSFQEVNTLVFPMVAYLGPYISCDPILLMKLIRLSKQYMIKRAQGSLSPEDAPTYYGLLNVIDEALLPSVSFLSCNCCISQEIWTLLKLFPYELRYRMYGNWKNELYISHPALIRVKADCLEKSKYIMKRLAKENVKISGRQLGKLSHSNPGVLFEYILRQVEKYDNLIGPVVDALKYLTDLSYDILIFCIIESVAVPEKEKTKLGETTLASWLQSLATFAGCICKKYTVEQTGLVQYVTNQLKAGRSTDLLLMQEIVQKMAGIEVSEEITADQLDAMSGGELLRQEGGYFTQVRNMKKSSSRLKDTMLEHDLALSLCLLISQQRDSVIFKEATRHLKHYGKLYDQCQDTLVQFGSFLSMQLSTEEFVKRLPPIHKMVTEFHVPPDAAFFLSRPLYSYDINAKYDELRKAERAEKDKKDKLSTSAKTQKYIEAAEFVMAPVIENVRPLQPSKIWEELSPTFYATFWALSMYDIHVPSSAYEKQISLLQGQANSADDNKDLGPSKRKKERERCNAMIDKLKDEEKRQTEHVQRITARLKAQRDQWFVSRATKNETITQFLQLCIFPRCCFTASDAVYCAEFIHILHNLKTPNFSTLICYDRIFCDITYTVSSCTENEAQRYGRFLCAALDTVMRWHSSKEFYEKECGAYPGFVTVFRKGENSNQKADQLDYENYRHVCHKWHFRITKAMVTCIESSNYIQIRNALIVLTKILPHYPRIVQFGSPLERRVDRLKQEEKEKRPDLFALAMGYSGQLKSKKQFWVPETDFHVRDKEKKAAAAAAAASAPVSGSSADAAKDKQIRPAGSGERSSASKEKEPKKTKTDKAEKTLEKARSEEKGRDSPVDAKKSNSSTATEKKEVTLASSKASGSKDKKEKEKSEKLAEPDKARSEDKMDKSKDDKATRKDEKGIKAKEEKIDTHKVKIKREDKSDIVTPLKLKVKQEKVEPPEESENLRSDRKEKGKEKKGEKERLKVKVEKDGDEPKGKDVRDKEEKLRAKLERMKEETKDRHEKEGRKEKHDRKLKRSYSPEEAAKEVMYRDHRDAEAASNSSHGSHRQTPEASPRRAEERDTKRRKTEAIASTSKEDLGSSSKSRHRHSVSPDKERERKEKKRDREYETMSVSMSKKKKSLDGSLRGSKQNGDSDDRWREGSYEQHYDDDGYARPTTTRKEHREAELEHERSRSKDREKKKDKERSKRPKKS